MISDFGRSEIEVKIISRGKIAELRSSKERGIKRFWNAEFRIRTQMNAEKRSKNRKGITVVKY